MGVKMTTEQLQERITQCYKDIATLQAEAVKLEQEVKEKAEPKFGDIINYYGLLGIRRRVWLYDEKGKLRAFNKYKKSVGTYPSTYKPTGESIFDILDLDN